MSALEVVSLELQRHTLALPRWADGLRNIALEWGDPEPASAWSIGAQPFSGRIEAGRLGDSMLVKVAAKPFSFSRSLTIAPSAASKPILFLGLISGRVRLQQQKKSCTLSPGDWCLIDTLFAFEGVVEDSRIEYFVTALERPTDPAMLELLRNGLARRHTGKTGVARVLQSTIAETFNQLSRIVYPSGKTLQKAITGMAWAALREQLEAPPPLSYGDMQIARLKAYIESHLDEPELSVDSIAQGCAMSVRSVHRAFAADPAGSVSKHIWMRRLSRCAAELRDPRQAHRPITDICFSWGFNSTSHFSRVFKDRFGVSPRAYRPPQSNERKDPHSERSGHAATQNPACSPRQSSIAPSA